jgi:type I restriction enzyme M protein
VLLLRRRSATDTDVLVVDASTLAADTRPRATLLPVHLDHVVALVQAFRRAGTASSAGVLEPQIAYRATLAEIARQDYSLAIPRYVATAPVAPIYDLPAIQAELTTLETQLLTVRSQMQVCLAALGTPQMQTAQIKAAEQPFTRF